MQKDGRSLTFIPKDTLHKKESQILKGDDSMPNKSLNQLNIPG